MVVMVVTHLSFAIRFTTWPMAIFSRAALDSRTLLRKMRDITAPLA